MAAQPTSLPPYPRSQYDGVRMSLAEFEALPEEKPYLEYWDGVVIQKAVAKKRHGIVADELLAALREYRLRVGGRSWPEGQVWFSGRGYRVPDVVYWAPDKPQGTPDRSLPPTLAVEILSPKQSVPDLRKKCREMRAEGVDVCWLIDPDNRWAETFDGDLDAHRLPANGSLTSPNLPGFELPLAILWAALDE